MSDCRPSSAARQPSPGGLRARLTVAVALVLTLAILPGCGVLGGGARPKTAVRSPVEVTFFVANPIEEVAVSEEKEGSSYRSLTITGLRDERVQKRINDSLGSLFATAKKAGPPPYRGSKARIPEGSKLDGQYITMHMMGSFNNVLSVALNVHANYTCPDGTSAYYSYTSGLNFDLTTGAEIALRDVFTDDSSFPGLLNSAVAEKLDRAQAAEEGWFFDMELGLLKLVRPFAGIAADQAFLLSEQGLYLIFDHRTPQFETGMQAALMRLPWTRFGDKVAITERFPDGGDDLYTSDAPPVKSLLGGSETPDLPDRRQEKVGRVNVYTTIVNSSAYPPVIQERVRLLAIRDETEIRRLNQAAEGLSQADLERYGEPYYSLTVSAFPAGRYVSISRTVYSAAPPMAAGDMRQIAEYFCYDRATGREVSFTDVFTPGYDPAPLTRRMLRDSIMTMLQYEVESGQLSQQAAAEAVAEASLDRLYRSIRGVMLSTSDLNLSLPPVVVGGREFPVWVSVPYREIGAANLVIFR